MKLIRNAKTLLSNPKIAPNYLNYWGSKLKASGQPYRVYDDGIKLTGFNGFSEFFVWNEPIKSEEKEFLYNYPFEAGALIDIGANLGLISMILAKRYPEKRVYSFEPNPSTFQNLKDNVQLNLCNNIRVEKIAVGDRDGEILFHADPIVRGLNSIADAPNQHTINVPFIKLDTYAQIHSIKEVAFLKVDVEGYEALVFQGAQQLLRDRQIRIIFYEICPDLTRKAGFRPELPTQILRQNAYEIYKLDARGSLVLAEDSEIERVVWENWIAIPK